jgi:3,4-dihydroxy 2-butanone 4-phosphate synthase/GTP cyclohydrolase II
VVQNLVKTRIPTEFGDFDLFIYRDAKKEHLALVRGDVAGQEQVPVRVHSECLTGDVFSSRRCDCGPQLRHTLQFLGRQKAGVLIYMRQEGRGIGLLKKMEAYNLQDQGMDTVEANLHLGHQADEREYHFAAKILSDLKVRSIRLITNNPHKVSSLQELGVSVEGRLPIEVGYHEENSAYLRSKAEKMAHLLTFSQSLPDRGEFQFISPLLDQLSVRPPVLSSRPHLTWVSRQRLSGESLPITLGVAELNGLMARAHDGIMMGLDAFLARDSEGSALLDANAQQKRVIIASGDRVEEVADLLVGRLRARDALIVSTGLDPRIREKLESKAVLVFEPAANSKAGNWEVILHHLCEIGIGGLLVTDSATANQLNHLGFLDYAVIEVVLKHDSTGSVTPSTPLALRFKDSATRQIDSSLFVYGGLG